MPPPNHNSDGNLLPNEPTYIVACSGAEARIFLSDRRFGAWKQIGTLDNPGAALRDQDRVTDRPGRAFDSVGRGRHAMSPEESPRDHEMLNFAGDISHYLAKAQGSGQFRHLVLVAEPSMLGFIRRKLSPQLKRTVSFEAPKNPAEFNIERLQSLFK